MDILSDVNGYALDDYQRKIVLAKEKAILVVAGAGSGKSLTILGKILYLVKVEKVREEEILCISFTNEATNSLKEKLYNKYDLKIDIYTFHKLALTIIKESKEEYNIAIDNLLDDTIDNFFSNVIPYNKKFKKAIKIIDENERNLKRLIKTFISLFKSNGYDLSYYLKILKKIKWTISYKKYLRNKNLLLLIINVYLLYEKELKDNNSLDFNDMINRCISLLKDGKLMKKWKYIIIDEYQDTSLTKFRMIEEIIKITGANLLVVGDDFQSIYRFTGCDLNIFLNFNKYFKKSKVYKIVNTYRNSQELINVSGDFVMKNRKQIKKKLYSSKHLDNPIKVIFTKRKIKEFKRVLEECKYDDIMVIGRNNNDILKYIDKDFIKEDNYYRYKDKSFRYLTVHKSKGLESDFVILINLEDSLVGFPTKIKNNQILKYVNNLEDKYPFEEERRLFYVALTRSKNYVYIIVPYKNPSIFVKEILKYRNVEQIKR